MSRASMSGKPPSCLRPHSGMPGYMSPYREYGCVVLEINGYGFVLQAETAGHQLGGVSVFNGKTFSEDGFAFPRLETDNIVSLERLCG